MYLHWIANLRAMLEFLLLCLIVLSSEQGREALSQPGRHSLQLYANGWPITTC